MRPAPNLNDADERKAYRRELMAVAAPLRRMGVAFAVIGTALLLVDALWRPLPQWLPLGVLGIAFFLMILAITVRTKYHHRRMRGEG